MNNTDVLLDKIPLLDHGYLLYVEHWGSDEGIIEAARMSTGKGFLGWGPRLKHYDCLVHGDNRMPVCCEAAKRVEVPGDEKLLSYLWKNKHMTPFEMAGLTVEVQAPIMDFRQWHRHRTQSYNEHSARYGPLPPLDYVPTIERIEAEVTGTRQAEGTAPFNRDNAQYWTLLLKDYYQQGEDLMQYALANGVPKELARLSNTVGRYSKMRASANLRNWLGFLTLRMDKHAQEEIRVYANAVGSIIAQLFPRTWALFSPGSSNG